MGSVLLLVTCRRLNTPKSYWNTKMRCRYFFLFLIISLFLEGTLEEGVIERRRPRPTKCKNPNGLLGSSMMDQNCGQAVCKKTGKKAEWESCPRPATQDRIEKLEEKLEETMKSDKEMIMDAMKRLEQKMEETFVNQTQNSETTSKGEVHCNLCLNEEDSNHVRSVVTNFMNKFDVAGSSFALVKDSRIVFAEGYGVMDRDTKEPVQATSLFRIASLSKPVTSAILMMMIEKQPSLLNATIFGENGLLGTKYGA